MAFAPDNQCLIVIKIYAADDLMNGVGESTTPNSMYFSIYSFICLFVFAHWLLWCVNFEPLNWCLFVSTHSICLTTHFIRYFIKISLMPNKNNDQLIHFMSFCVRCITESFTLLRFWLKNYSTINPEKYCNRSWTKFSNLANFRSFHSIIKIINSQNA